MADGIESFSESRNLARVRAGWNPGPYFNSPQPLPSMDIGAGWPTEVEQKLQYTPTTAPQPTDPWVVRYPGAKMK